MLSGRGCGREGPGEEANDGGCVCRSGERGEISDRGAALVRAGAAAAAADGAGGDRPGRDRGGRAEPLALPRGVRTSRRAGDQHGRRDDAADRAAGRRGRGAGEVRVGDAHGELQGSRGERDALGSPRAGGGRGARGQLGQWRGGDRGLCGGRGHGGDDLGTGGDEPGKIAGDAGARGAGGAFSGGSAGDSRGGAGPRGNEFGRDLLRQPQLAPLLFGRARRRSPTSCGRSSGSARRTM